ncbi:MAG: VOC family protein [Mucilaginibacter sp.]
MKGFDITLLFDGQTEEAFNFYKSVFGGEFSNLQRMSDMPSPMEMSESEKRKILHMALPIGNTILMGMDMPPGRGTVNKGNNFFVTLNTSSEAETDELFGKLSDGANIMMPVAKQFWGAYFGMLTDKFGIQWMLSYSEQR